MYSTGIEVSTINLIQDANTVDGGDNEQLTIGVHHNPIGGTTEEDSFIVLTTNQWAIDYRDIDNFAEYLKSLILKKV